MSLTCVECGTVNADDGAFCTGCGVSLAFATPSSTTAPLIKPVVRPVAQPAVTVPRNAFPEEPGRASGSSGALPWVLGGAMLLVAAVGATGWWAFQRTGGAAADPVPVTRVEPAASDPGPAVEASDTALPADAVAPVDSLSPQEIVIAKPPRMASPPPPAAEFVPPVVAPPGAKAVQPPKPRVQARRAAENDADDDDEAPPRRAAARPVGPVGGGPASACYGRTGALMDTCIAAQCRQPYYRNHPGCRGY